MRTNAYDRKRLQGLLKALDFYRSGILRQENPVNKFDEEGGKADEEYGLSLLQRWLKKKENEDYFSFLQKKIGRGCVK